MPDATGTLQSRGMVKPDDARVTRATIDGVPYYVPDYVLSFLSRHADGSVVDYRFEEGKDGRRLTKIAKHKEASNPPAAEKREERVLHPVTVISVSPVTISFQFMEGQRNKSSIPMTDSGYKIVMTTLDGKVPPVDAAISWNPSTGYLNDFKLPGVSMALDEWDTLVKKYLPHPEEFKPASTLPKDTPSSTQDTQEKTRSPLLPPPNTTITVAAKVNLDHYEMLSVSVSGEAADRDALVAYLDESLAMFGRDEVTKERIAAYRRRVLPAVPA